MQTVLTKTFNLNGDRAKVYISYDDDEKAI